MESLYSAISPLPRGNASRIDLTLLYGIVLAQQLFISPWRGSGKTPKYTENSKDLIN